MSHNKIAILLAISDWKSRLSCALSLFIKIYWQKGCFLSGFLGSDGVMWCGVDLELDFYAWPSVMAAGVDTNIDDLTFL